MNAVLCRSALATLALLGFAPRPDGLAQDQPRLVIDDVTVPVEANGGVGNARFTVSFADTLPHGQVTVFYSTTGGTATAGTQCSVAGTDYVGRNNFSLSFNSSQSSRPIDITLCGDTWDEPDQTFLVNLFDASGAVTQDGQGQATLIDDDPPPTLRVNDVTLMEGAAGATANAVFTVTLTGLTDNAVSVQFATADGTARAGSCGTPGADYEAAAGPVNFSANQTSPTTQTRSVRVCGDGVSEGNQQFQARLSNPSNASIQDATGVGTITDDEPLPTLTITPTVSMNEPFQLQEVAATLTVNLAGPPTEQAASVNFATSPGTATASLGQTCSVRQLQSDYVSRTGTLTFPTQPPAAQTISVPICYDLLRNEPDETFTVSLSNPQRATIAGGVGTATIR